MPIGRMDRFGASHAQCDRGCFILNGNTLDSLDIRVLFAEGDLISECLQHQLTSCLFTISISPPTSHIYGLESLRLLHKD